MQVTIQTKIAEAKSIKQLEKMCERIAGIRSSLLCDVLKGREANELKREYIRKYGLTARQYNSVSSEVRGMIQAAKRLKERETKEAELRIKSQKQYLKKLGRVLKKLEKKSEKREQEIEILHKKIEKEQQNLEETKKQRQKAKLVIRIELKIKAQEKQLKELEKLLKAAEKEAEDKKREKEIKSLRWRIHQKKRKLKTMEDRLQNKKKKKISICLGSKKLFLAQYNLKENGYESHEEWQEKWRKKRSNRIFFIGSKDERFGNQNCQLIGNHLQVRMLPSLEEEMGQYIEVPVEFSYGQEIVRNALQQQQAISYRFVHKEKGWYLFLTTKRMGVEKQTRKSLGGIGVDLNKAHLAWAEINRHGNLVKFGKIGIEIQDRRSDQVTASLGEAIKEILEYAKKQQKPIVIEKLDFQHKKAKESGRGGSCARYRRMLSYFAYSKFMEIMYSRAFREGVEIIAVNPAYSSIIGRCKFAEMYGISVHIAASLVLARRGLELGESFPSTQYLAEHRYWHIWKKWARFAAVSNREKQVGFVPRLTSNRKRPPLGGFF